MIVRASYPVKSPAQSTTRPQPQQNQRSSVNHPSSMI
jgi:hypothetical protein